MDSIPSGPRGPHRPQHPTPPNSDQGAVQQVPVEKQIPSGQPLARTPLDERKIDIFNPTPIIPKPSRPTTKEYLGADVRERVMTMLRQMEPDVDASMIHRVSSERQQEMAERVARVQQALGKKSVRETLDSGPLLDLETLAPAMDITLNYVTALAWEIQSAQDVIRAEIDANPGSVQAWKKGLRLYSKVQDAWHELHPIVSDIINHEPLAFEPSAPFERMDSKESVDSGVGDLLDLDSPWDQPQSLASPDTSVLSPAAEARISQLEQELGNTLDHIRHERTASELLQQSQGKVEDLTRSNQHLVDQYQQLQRDVEFSRSKPVVDSGEVQRLKGRIDSLETENTGLLSELSKTKQALREQSTEISGLKNTLRLKEVEISTARSLPDFESKQFAAEKQQLEAEVSSLEETLSQRQEEVSALKETVQQLEDSEKELSSQVSSQSMEIDSLKSTLTSVRSEIVTVRNEAEGLREQVNSLECRLKSKDTEYKELLLRHQTLIDEKSQFEHLKEQDKVQHESTVTRLTGEITKANEEKTEISQSLDEVRRQEEDLKRKVTDLEKERGELKETVTSLSQHNETLAIHGRETQEAKDREIETLQKSLSEKEKSRVEAVTEIEQRLQSVTDELEKFTKSTEDESEDYASELTDFKDKGRSEFIANLDEIKRLKQQLKEAEDNYANKLQEAETSHQSELSEQSEVIVSNRKEIERQKKEVEDQKINIERLEAELTEKKNELENYKKESERGNSEAVSRLKDEVQKVRAELDKFIHEGDEVGSDLDEEIAEFKQKGQAHFVAKIQELNELKEQLDSMQKEHAVTVQENAGNYQRELEVKDNELNASRGRVEETEHLLSEKEEEIKKLSEDLEAKKLELKRDSDKFKAEEKKLVEKHKEDISEKERALDELEEKLSQLESSLSKELSTAEENYTSELSTKDGRIAQLSADNERLLTDLSETVVKSELDEEQKKRKTAEESAGSAVELATSLKTQLQTAQEELESKKELETRLEELSKNKQELEDQLVSAHSDSESVRSQLVTKEGEHAAAIESEQNKSREAMDKLKQESEESLRQESVKVTEAKEALSLERDKNKEELQALTDELLTQKNKYEQQLKAKDDEHKTKTVRLESTAVESDQLKEKAHQDELMRINKQFEEERARLQDAATKLAQEVKSIKQKNEDELKRVKSDFDGAVNELESEYQKALSSEKQRVEGIESANILVREEAETRNKELVNQSQTKLSELKSSHETQLKEKEKALSDLVSKYQDDLEEKEKEFSSAQEKLQQEADQKLKEVEAAEQEKVRDAEAAVLKITQEASQEKDTLLKKHRVKMAALDKEHKVALEQQKSEAALTLSQAENNLKEEFQKTLSREKQPLEEEVTQLKTAVSDAKKTIESNETELAQLKGREEAFTLEVTNLQGNLKKAEQQLKDDSETASAQQEQLRNALKSLQEDADKAKREADEKLNGKDIQLTDISQKATEDQEKLQKRITELSRQESALSEEVDELKSQLVELENLKQKNSEAIDRLQQENDTLTKQTSEQQSKLEEIAHKKASSKSIEIQTEPEHKVRVKAFIEALKRQHSRSGSTSGFVSDFSDMGFSDEDSVSIDSETLYRRPGSTGKGKTFHLDSMLESSLSKLQAMGETKENPTPVDIAFQQAIKSIESKRRGLDSQLQGLATNELALAEADEPPSHSPLRKARIQLYETYAEELDKLHKKFNQDVEGGESQFNDKAAQLSVAMEDYIGKVNFSVSFQKHRENEFDKLKNQYSTLPQSEVSTPEGRVHDIQISLKEVMRHTDPEVRDYVAGAYVKEAAEQILAEGLKTVKESQGDMVRQELVRFETCLRRLTPDSLPLYMGQNLGPMGRQYITRIVDRAVTELKKEFIPAPLESQEESLIRGEPGLELAKNMVENPDIRPSVLALLTSLQPTHEGVAIAVDYYEASLVGLKRIRDEFRLVDMPTMEELLTYAVHDLQSDNSLLATEAQKRHRQTAVDKASVPRKDKMQVLCKGYLEKEKSGDAPEFASCRGQSHQEGVMVVHPHREVLDCFKKGGHVLAVDDVPPAQTQGQLQVHKISGVSGGLLNTFFDKAPGSANLITSERASLQCIRITSPDTKPEGVVFKYSAREKCWQVNLGNTLWNVDPAFNLDNPNLKIPFEAREVNITQRDWIPLRSQSGETAILALQKIHKNGRYFLYQKGNGDTLVPKVIGSSNPEQERIEAQFFYDVALASVNGETVTSYQSMSTNPLVKQFNGASLAWLGSALNLSQLQGLYDRASQKVSMKPAVCPVKMSNAEDNLNVKMLEDSPYRQIQKKKESKTKAASGSDIKAEHTGSKLTGYNPKVFGQFSVDANFDLVGEHYIEECYSQLKGSDALLQQERRDRKKFRQEAFKELAVYKGAELKPYEIQDRSRRRMIEGTPEYSRQILIKVVSTNRDHQLRLAQGLDEQCRVLIKEVRGTVKGDELAAYSDSELLDFLILEFEKGNVPLGLEFNSYIKKLTSIMLARNDLEQTAKLASRLKGLMTNLEQLERDADIKARRPEYVQDCQKWNLDMALIATEQGAVAGRLDSYIETTLASGTRARMSFECRVKTVLRENQVEEVEAALGEITHAMKDTGGTMSRISQKGTGWGKSTIIQMLTDHACAQNQERARSVLVIAPESNQAELDITLGRYFAQKGLNYKSLDIESQYVKPANGQPWWKPENLDKMYLTLLGLPEDDIAQAYSPDMLQKPRAPVGISVKNVQILMQLRNKLQHKAELSVMEQDSLKRLDKISDLVCESMVFMDEWDRTLMPPGPEELKGIADSVNRTLKPFNFGEVKAKDIMQCHGQMVQGCKRKHMLSATVQSGFTAAVASGVTKAEEINEQCHTDVFTTQQRFWHWLSCAKPVYVHLKDQGGREGREQLFSQVLDEVGTERELVIFDGNRRDGKADEQAVADYKILSSERKSRGGKSRGVLYYDEHKRLHKYEKGDPVYESGTGAPLPVEEEEFIKSNRGRDIDVVLTHRESIGTDAPQGPDSVGVYIGLVEQKEDGRTSLAAQQMGRMMRASGDLRKPQALYIAVDLDAIDELPGSKSEKKVFKEAHAAELELLEKVSREFGLQISGLDDEIKELINAPVQFSPPRAESMKQLEPLTEKAMVKEVERLADEEWVDKGLTVNQSNALAELKKAQWRTKQAYLLLMASEFARREVSTHTKSCESVLNKANVESHLERVYADEQAWLHSGMDGQVRDYELKALGFKDEKVKQIASSKITAAVAQEIETISRRTSKADGSLEAVNREIMPDPIKGEITDRLIRLKGEGITTEPWEELDRPASNILDTGATRAPTIRQELVKESSNAFTEALKRTGEVIQRFQFSREQGHKKIRPIGFEQIEILRDELDQKARLITSGDQAGIAGINEALKTQQTIEHHYQELMRAICWAGFDATTMSGQGTECEKAFSQVCKVMGAVIKIPKNRKTTTKNVGQPTWSKDEKFKGTEFGGSFLSKTTFSDAVKKRLKDENGSGFKAGVSGVFRLNWKTKPEVSSKSSAHDLAVYKPVSVSVADATQVKPDAISNSSALNRAVRAAEAALEQQHRSDEAMMLCQKADGTDTKLFEACVDEVLEQLLGWYEQYSQGVQVYSQREQERIRQQSQLMQAPIQVY